MWHLLPLAPRAVGSEGNGQSAALHRRYLAEARQSMDEMAQLLGQVAESGLADLPEYRAALSCYQDLSHTVAGAARALKASADAERERHRTGQLLPAGADLSGIRPLKGTLAAPGTPGVVSVGPEVRNLQQFLAAVGYPVPPSGTFDLQTRLAVQQFQEKFRVPADGKVGAATRKLINEMLGNQPGG